MKTIFKIIFGNINILIMFVLFLIQFANICWIIFSTDFRPWTTLFAICVEFQIFGTLMYMIINTYNYQNIDKKINNYD